MALPDYSSTESFREAIERSNLVELETSGDATSEDLWFSTSPPTTPSVLTKSEKCFIYGEVKRINNSTFLGISGFEGIPQNVFINLVAWLVLHALFIILRKKAWNYGRMAVVQKEEIKWADMFYGTNDGDDISLNSFASSSVRPVVVVAANDPEAGIVSNDQAGTAAALKSVQASSTGVSDDAMARPGARMSAESTDAQDERNLKLPSPTASEIANISEISDKGYFSWIKIVLTLTDKQYLEKCGPDCLHYLSFQRHLILLGIIITFSSLCIVLPINLSGNAGHGESSSKNYVFSDTIMVNLGTNFNLLWCHIFFALLFLVISIFVMRHFSKELEISTEDLEEEPTRTVEIIGVNRKKCNEELLRAHLAETYPGTEVVDVSFAYSIRTLEQIEFERLSAASAKVYFQELYDKAVAEGGDSVSRPMIKPYTFGNIACKCCKCCKETDAIEYYANLENDLTEKVEVERKKALTKPLGIAYVTFSSLESAENIVEDYACSARLFLHAPISKYTAELHSNQWIVKFAPKPDNIWWENLSTDYKIWYAKWILVNLAVMVIAIFVSTPVYIFQKFGFLPRQDKHKQIDASDVWKDYTVVAGLLFDTIPTILLWIMSVLLIFIVLRSDLIVGYWTKSSGNLSEMIKTFGFLTFMIIILPSLGITSFMLLLYKDTTVGWSCIFYKDNGAFFVNYVCTSSLVGTAAELMRLPELFVYAIRISLARSEAETAAIRKSLLWDFQIGVAYAWTMLHFAIFTCFSVIFPLVTPFGLIYLLLKHFVDRYNIYFAYAPCKVDNSVHATAVNFVMMSMFMLQLNLLAYVHFHIGDTQNHDPNSDPSGDSKIRALQICSLLGFSITAAFFLGQCCFNICGDFSPIQQQKNPEVESVGSEERRRTRRRSSDSNLDEMGIELSDDRDRRRTDNAMLATRSGLTSGESVLKVASISGRTEGAVSSKSYGHGRYIPALLRPEIFRLHEIERVPEIVQRQEQRRAEFLHQK